MGDSLSPATTRSSLPASFRPFRSLRLPVYMAIYISSYDMTSVCVSLSLLRRWIILIRLVPCLPFHSLFLPFGAPRVLLLLRAYERFTDGSLSPLHEI